MLGRLAALLFLAGFVHPAVAANREQQLIVRGDRIFIPVTVNGRSTEALLDSAAELTLIDDDFAKAIGVEQEGHETVKGSGGEDKAQFANGVDIHAVGTDLKGLTVAVLDLDELSQRLVGTKVAVILGRELFDAGRFKLDIERGKISKLSQSVRPKGVMLPLVTFRGIEVFPIAIEGHSGVQAAFDLGNGSEMMIGRQAADRLGISAPGRILTRKKGGGIGGSVDRDIVSLGSISIAGKTFGRVPAAIEDQDSQSDANVGVKQLRHFIIVTDFPGRKLWLQPR
ncbi:retropepsin-like aspartic protease [Aquisediminimonas profunda]|uniref:retropepsin-like aspartic protease n=1 Tax=Aquisediminimonas profunda TaxID=1550733 RepID=UPI001C62ECB4|nr:retropepsin-like aspartic protease [Aquisediminimonas profunda]